MFVERNFVSAENVSVASVLTLIILTLYKKHFISLGTPGKSFEILNFLPFEDDNVLSM